MLDQLNSKGGHILVFLFLLIVGLVSHYLKIEGSDLLVIGAYSGLFYSMDGSGALAKQIGLPALSGTTVTNLSAVTTTVSEPQK